MAKRLVTECDSCGNEISDNRGATLRLNYDDSRRGSKTADICGDCADKVPGKPAKRRGRPPKLG
jgi:hypothetical protein